MLVICEDYKKCSKTKIGKCRFRTTFNPVHFAPYGPRWAPFEKNWRAGKEFKTVHCEGEWNIATGGPHKLMEWKGE